MLGNCKQHCAHIFRHQPFFGMQQNQRSYFPNFFCLEKIRFDNRLRIGRNWGNKTGSFFSGKLPMVLKDYKLNCLTDNEFDNIRGILPG